MRWEFGLWADELSFKLDGVWSTVVVAVEEEERLERGVRGC
jgi:hypothetical protein